MSYNIFKGSIKTSSLFCIHILGELIKRPRPAFDKIFFPDYHSNDIENCLVLFLVRQIRFSDSSGFNQPFFPVEIGDVVQKAPFENLQKRVQTPSKISLCSPSKQ